MMSAGDCTVYPLHLIGNIAAIVENIKNKLPKARFHPPVELLINRPPFPEFFRKITPLRAGSCDPEYAIQNAAMIAGLASCATVQ